MVIASNIQMTDELALRVDSGTLTISDYLLLSLGNFTAALFPAAITYTETQQQAVEGPALFVDYYDIKNSQRLIDSTEYTFGFEITYVPQNRISSYELNSAIFTIEQSLKKLTSDIGTFSVYDKASDITDDLAHVTGVVSVKEITPDTADVIRTANQEIT